MDLVVGIFELTLAAGAYIIIGLVFLDMMIEGFRNLWR